ncbi:DNA methylase N-4 [Chryseobacterium sp. G0240]|uniref:DNA methyltransferase n=1 Tax=Chryseobacterium sp. G0240 TaxID=2487066 RepID=UPI000F44CB32|nr:DNA methyltransferase [Chryseobacterium sp. G0240]ROI05481.1 DNA methylase N-4 [Chryseobacterium sp. G0240]
MNYQNFLKNKVIVSENFGFEVSELSPKLHLHQPDIVRWCLKGGRRAIFASFGLGKSMMQLEIAKQCIKKENKPFLIVCPLGVIGEFKRDNEKLKTGLPVIYITDSDLVPEGKNAIFITNYERVRKGDIDPLKFSGVSFDEASILRNLKTETTNYVLNHFKKVPYRFVATATPTPNDFIEILNYAEYLGVADRGHLLTRFFKRDSQKAGNLLLLENKKNEFWKWVATWAVFINKPSDLGYDDSKYNLPKLHIHEIEVENITDEIIVDKYGKPILFKDNTKSLIDTSREKSQTVDIRVKKALEIVQKEGPEDNWILWHHLEAERMEIEKKFKGHSLKSVYGAQDNNWKEELLIGFSQNQYQILSTKPKIAGSGCNFQYACHKMIFVGIDFKFNDFIQAIHRVYRFMQDKEVHVYIIFTQNEREVLKTLFDKWRKHDELQTEMISLVREYGLNSELIKSQMERQIFKNGRKLVIGDATLYNNDTVIVHSDPEEIPDNSIGMHLTSIPFGDHYEYSDNYNDFGHNDGNEEFFKQMEFLTPELYRTLKPGRIAAIHVKDRPRYSHQTDVQFFTIEPFSDATVRHFTKQKVKDQITLWEGLTAEDGISEELKSKRLQELKSEYENRFHFIGRITITTDVVRENNQTYRLGWGEQRKDASKMGVGIPEYILLFRKPPSHTKNAYADDPVSKKIDEYLLSMWQLDAHSYWRSSGNRFLSADEIKKFDMDKIYNAWKKHNTAEVYDYKKHLEACNMLESEDKLSKLFMTLPPHSNQECVWSDINRMNTLNAKQVNSKKEKHICPLQLDIIERLIYRFTNEGDIVDDCFGGLFSTPYISLKLKRKAISCELNSDYFNDGVSYINAINYQINMPTLFDFIDA